MRFGEKIRTAYPREALRVSKQMESSFGGGDKVSQVLKMIKQKMISRSSESALPAAI